MQCQNKHGCSRPAVSAKSPYCPPCFVYWQWQDKHVRYQYIKFTDQVNKTATCWHWTGCKTKNGYGLYMAPNRRIHMAHRASYEHYVGDVPGALVLDHLCRNRGCVNFEHLEPVTTEENNARRGLPPTVAVSNE